jgi:prophage regulatory protein
VTHDISNTGQTCPPDRLLRMQDLLDITGLSRATVYRAVCAGSFPKPIKIGGASRWPASELAAYIEARKSARAEDV